MRQRAGRGREGHAASTQHIADILLSNRLRSMVVGSLFFLQGYCTTCQTMVEKCTERSSKNLGDNQIRDPKTMGFSNSTLFALVPFYSVAPAGPGMLKTDLQITRIKDPPPSTRIRYQCICQQWPKNCSLIFCGATLSQRGCAQCSVYF